MAELVINVHGNDKYEDGDIIAAFNDNSILMTHAWHICDPKYAGFSSYGLRPYSKSLLFFDCVYQYRFQRVNSTQVERIETDHSGNVISVETFGSPDINVEAFIQRRIKNPKHRIFGSTGKEIWHGGRRDKSIEATNCSWEIIQNNCDCRNTAGACPCCGQDHTLWPLGKLDIRRFLCTKLVDFNDIEATAMTSELEKEFQPEETVTDIDGIAVNPIWDDNNRWQHPTGGWIYYLNPETNVVSVSFKARNMKVSDWRNSVLDVIQKTESEVLDQNIVVGRETMCDCDKAPWMNGHNIVNNVLDHQPFSDPSLLYNKRDNQPGQRIPQGE